jgi:ribose 5-phosphate isomerase A
MDAKQRAAEKAVELIEDGMIVGLGTGTTAHWAIRRVAERIREGLNLTAVASSKQSERLAVELGIPTVSISEITAIDLTIDGADEVDGSLNLIKGGGGALLREKILAANSTRLIIIVDDSKIVDTLGRFPLPVEIVPFAANLTAAKLSGLGCNPVVRMKDGSPFVTDNGNLIADCHFSFIADPAQLSNELNGIPGVVENGLFVQMADLIIIGSGNGVATRGR